MDTAHRDDLALAVDYLRHAHDLVAGIPSWAAEPYVIGLARMKVQEAAWWTGAALGSDPVGLGQKPPRSRPSPIDSARSANMVIARFYVAEVRRYAYNEEQRQIVLQAVTRGDENASWSRATPAGKIELTVNNPPAGEWFESRLGKDIEITFQDAVPAAPKYQPE